ncbi:unnamed protein product [Eruca vesicaria subsp. sativa]|uniref:Folate receptor-like domain-containing protein n=1 Tax=Eruca vesicaria subsp. sativa TaxID=29727 RepID=A0ABC8J2J8_ERUVS|nr:unnamed protein product [Eruca vesicaria subsp. sativa]
MISLQRRHDLCSLCFIRCCCCDSGEEAVNSSENRVCVSKEGKLPKFADLEFKDLNLSNVFHAKTCCSRMLSASLATHGEASKDCLALFELLQCSICHPDVGVQSVPLRICASFCDSVFEACSDAYFTTHDQVVVPCGASNGTTICEKASKLLMTPQKRLVTEANQF